MVIFRAKLILHLSSGHYYSAANTGIGPCRRWCSIIVACFQPPKR
jgi:hypothetical protein